MQWIKSYDLPPEELKDIPAVASSLEEALNSLEKDYEFLTQGGVFAKDFIEAFINIKRKEVERLNMTPLRLSLRCIMLSNKQRNSSV